jgi:UDP-glucose 4-epimerase
MKVLVTGGMGVMGAEVSRKFVREGHRPVVLGRHRDDSLIGDIIDKIDIELGDITDLPRLLQTIKKHKVTHVVHLAAFVGAVSEMNPALSIQVNVNGTVNVFEAARLFDLQRVVYSSAGSVYAEIVGEHADPTCKPITEDYPKTEHPARIYDAEKLMTEHVAEYYGRKFGLDIITLRFSWTYGPGKTARHGNKGITSAIVENPTFGQPFKLAAGGEQRCDFIYNKDSALGVYLATVVPKPRSRVFNIGSGVGNTFRDFSAVIRKEIPTADIQIGPGLDPLGLRYSGYVVYDISRAKAELGYAPQFDLESGIADYVATLRTRVQ